MGPTWRPWPVVLPVVATIWFVAGVGMLLAFAHTTLGYDALAYLGAAHRLLDGQPLYDASAVVAGPFALFLYPPPFAVAFIPLTVPPADIAIWAWTILSVAMVVVAIAILPVRPGVRWAVLFLAGIDWPLVYAIKLGQVGPLVLLVFAIGWRGLRSPATVGAVAAIGALIKLQPALLFGWLLLTRQRRAMACGIVVILVVGLVTLPFVGLAAWPDYLDVIRRVVSPITTPNNYTPGALAFQAGLSEGAAAVIQVASMAVVLIVWVVACLRRPGAASYVVTIVASQLLSPLLWDHYAMLLLLPVAFLLQRRWWWAVLVPLTTNTFAFFTILAPVYPALVLLGFAVCLVAPIVVGPGEPVGAVGPAGPADEATS